MDDFLIAYKLGKEQAVEEFSKSASAKDLAAVMQLLGSGAKSGGKALGEAALKGGGALATGAKAISPLGLHLDPRMALLSGVGLAGAGLIGGELLAKSLGESAPKLVSAVPALLGATGGVLAAAANPGLLGGSRSTRITHELAQSAATPAGMVATMAGLVGLPAALIGYGKMKGREESSFF